MIRVCMDSERGWSWTLVRLFLPASISLRKADPILTISTRQVNRTFSSTPSLSAQFHHAALGSSPRTGIPEPSILHVDKRYRFLSSSTVRTPNSLLSLTAKSLYRRHIHYRPSVSSSPHNPCILLCNVLNSKTSNVSLSLTDFLRRFLALAEPSGRELSLLPPTWSSKITMVRRGPEVIHGVEA